MKSMIKSIVTLISVCLISAALLGTVNFLTKDKIKAADDAATIEALDKVMEGTPNPTPLNLEGVEVDSTVVEVYKSDKGEVAVKMSTKGFKTGFIIMCGVSADGKVVGSVCLDSNESYGYEYTYGENFIGKNAEEAEAVDTISGATKTSTGYKKAVKVAIETAKLVKDIPVIEMEEEGNEK